MNWCCGGFFFVLCLLWPSLQSVGENLQEALVVTVTRAGAMKPGYRTGWRWSGLFLSIPFTQTVKSAAVLVTQRARRCRVDLKPAALWDWATMTTHRTVHMTARTFLETTDMVVWQVSACHKQFMMTCFCQEDRKMVAAWRLVLTDANGILLASTGIFFTSLWQINSVPESLRLWQHFQHLKSIYSRSGPVDRNTYYYIYSHCTVSMSICGDKIVYELQKDAKIFIGSCPCLRFCFFDRVSICVGSNLCGLTVTQGIWGLVYSGLIFNLLQDLFPNVCWDICPEPNLNPRPKELSLLHPAPV